MTKGEREEALKQALAGQTFVLSPEESERVLEDRSRRFVGMGISDFESSVSHGTIAPSTSVTYMAMLAETDLR